MKIRSRLMALFLCLVLAVSLVVPVKAAGAALTAAEVFTSLWGMYSTTVGLDTVFSTNGVNNNMGNVFSTSSSNTIFSGLYNEYMTSISNNQSLTDWSSWALDRISVGASPSQRVTWQMASDLVQFYDEFATWLLETKLNLNKTASGHFSTSGTWYSTEIGNVNIVGMPVVNVYSPSTVAENKANGSAFHLTNRGTTNVTVYVSSNTANTKICLIPGAIYCFNTVPSVVCWGSVSSSTSVLNQITLTNQSNGIYYNWFTNGALQQMTASSDLPTFQSASAAISYYSQVSENSKIQLRPKDKYNEGVGSDVLGIPDVDATDYAADVMTGVLSLPYNDSVVGGIDAKTGSLGWVNDKMRENVDIVDPVASVEDSEVVEFSNNPNQYSVSGLSSVFPFCLPFDLYAFFECLAADPVAPSFEVPIEFPPLDLTYTFEIDLSEFNDVAALLRKLELLGFCVALILITRQKMIRG